MLKQFRLVETVYPTYTSDGKDLSLELSGCSGILLNERDFLEETLGSAAIIAKATQINRISHQFKPHGVTVLILLAESHITIHTWPEHRRASIAFYTCGEKADPLLAVDFLVKRLQAREYSLLLTKRGSEIEILKHEKSVKTAWAEMDQEIDAMEQKLKRTMA